MKKVLIIILCVLAAVLTALATVFMILKSGEKMVMAPISSISETSSDVMDTVSSIPEQPIIPVLTFNSPLKEKISTTESSITFSGNYSANTVIMLGDEQIPTDQNGNFTVSKELQFGNNQFVFLTETESRTFTVYRRYVIISSYSPNKDQIYSAGVYFPVSVTAKEGSQITATFNGVSINLTPNTVQNGLATYSGSFTMPSGHFRDLNLGKVAFTGTHNGFSETFYSGNVTCKKEDVVINYDPNATPSGGIYTNVGSGIITEIVGYQAETFDVGTNKDTSKPFNNYLPKGTVDYGSADTYSLKRDGDTYELITLRCGKTIYKSMRDKPSKEITAIANQYVGVLPDHNEITFNSLNIQNSHTVLTLDVNWKAPFYFELMPQSYNSDLTITDITYNYVDITFCYSTVFNGEISIPQDNPLFSSATVIKNANDYTLRLFLKKQGGFYGWDSYYNENGSLCFEFLNPKKITLTDANIYGADLTGVNILIDVGHGGMDVGALRGRDLINSEANRNLILAKKLATELSLIGATVHITRADDITSTTNDKITLLKHIKPDYCIAIHHDSNNSSSLNGFGSYYFHPFSKKAAEYVLNNTFNTGIYQNQTFKFHNYFVSRSSVCPVVLTENGYMSNVFDFNNIINDNINTQKAQALTKGIVQYFMSLL